MKEQKKQPISKKRRQQVTDRANEKCEYCFIPANLTFYRLQVDHIIPERQGGPTTLENLALACKPCNCKKGYSVVRYYYDSGKSVRLFNPRNQDWNQHFELLTSGEIKCLTETAVATAEMLDFNNKARVEFRERMIANKQLET